MKFDVLITHVGKLPFFDLPLLVQISREPRKQLITQIHQWVQKGHLLHLRRGMYTLEDHYRKTPLSVPQLANAMYHPSYLSSLWALSFYGLIPEKVPLWMSVTTRVTRHFQNSFGVFSYFTLKKSFFWGFTSQRIEEVSVWIAEPEKALLDYFYLHAGEWSEARLREMRFQHLSMLDVKKLSAYTKRWASPRLTRAIERLKKMIDHQEEGYITL